MNSLEKRSGEWVLKLFDVHGTVIQELVLKGTYDEDRIEFIGGVMFDTHIETAIRMEVWLDGVLQ